MARAGGAYSRVIAWLKILLPLAALALLSTLFLLSDSRDTLENVPFADALNQGDVATPGVSAPYYSGMTDDGELLTMTARRARPLAGGDIETDMLEARVHLSDGSTLTLIAQMAQVSDSDNALTLGGGVTIQSSQGYVLQTDAMIARTDRVEGETEGHVTGTGPLGTLDAGRMKIVPANENGAVQMHFTDGVKLVYQPPEKDDTP
ncbi:hypothetical protein J4E08_05775 [Sagittula sp. NFXS13]|uniref:LPS export ABC transporter periplasmic protein LptC n=1 Tax=Sagittula sp. NFXS13 TaxID=2819095 RepID=UPI0032DF7E82